MVVRDNNAHDFPLVTHLSRWPNQTPGRLEYVGVAFGFGEPPRVPCDTEQSIRKLSIGQPRRERHRVVDGYVVVHACSTSKSWGPP
jgi:hypothetical protein